LGRLVTEKAPLLVLSAMSSAVTLWAQTEAIDTMNSFEVRFLNAALSYLRYLVKMVWPARLYLNYPMPHGWPISYPLFAVFAVGCLSVLAVREARKRPYLFTGWFWFLGTLVPVIGLVEVGMQSMADRYTYVPLIGLFLIVAWLGCDLAEEWRFPPLLLRTLGVAAVISCIPVTIIQVGYWKNGFTLFQHALRLNPDNYLAELDLALTYESEGQLEPALQHLLKAQKLNPYLGAIDNKIGWTQFHLGNEAAAIEAFQTALQHQGAPSEAHLGLALVFEKQGRSDDAITQLQAALPTVPDISEDPAKYNRLLKDILEKMKTTPPNVIPLLSPRTER
jgi:tetratricopeptide (TPR) repeat protein